MVDLVRDLGLLTGASFERCGYRLIDQLAPRAWQHRGTNLEGAPVSGVVDSVADGGRAVAQYSSEHDYFSNSLAKLRKDIKQAHHNHPPVKALWLLSNRKMGPKSATVVQNLISNEANAGCSLHVVDAIALADGIIDNLHNEGFVSSIEEHLPFLKRIRLEWATSHRVPEYPSYQARPDDEAAVERMLTTQGYAQVVGLSGVGKSALCSAIANRAKDRFELVLWVDGSQIRELTEIYSHDVLRNGSPQNIRGLLQSRASLLVIDNAQVEFDLSVLLKDADPGTQILLSSQFASRGGYVLRNVDQTTAQRILDAAGDTPCPAAEFEVIWGKVGGHPLILAIVGALAADDGWATATVHCKDPVQLEDDNHQLLCQRLLRQHATTMRRELAFITWCGTPRIDAGLLEAICGSGSIRKLQKRHFLSAAEHGVVSVHDLIFRSATYLAANEPHSVQFNDDFADFLARKIHSNEPGLARCTDIHTPLLERLLASGDRHAAIRHGLALQWQKGIPVDLLGDPLTAAQSLLGNEDAVAVWSILETIEAIFHSATKKEGATVAKSKLRSLLATFDVLQTSFGHPLRRDVIHHRGKALRWLGDNDEAIACFEQLVKDDATFCAARLQLARLLGSASETAPAALQHIEYILDAAERQAPSVSQTVALAAFESLKRDGLLKFMPALVERHLPLLARLIEERLPYSREQPLATLAGMAASLWYEHPDLLSRLAALVPATDLNLAPEEVRFALAQMHKMTGKAARDRQSLDEAHALFEQAEGLYSELLPGDPFRTVQRSENLLLLKRPNEATLSLSCVPPEKRDAFWYQRNAQALLQLKQHPEALACIEAAIQTSKARFRSTFLHDRWLIRRAMHDANAIDDLDAAIECCDSLKQRQRMIIERDELERPGKPSVQDRND